MNKDLYSMISKRKTISEIWESNYYLDIADIVRFTPSPCNTKPWKVESFKNELKVYGIKKMYV